MDADAYRPSALSPADTAEHDEVFGALADSVRELLEAQLLTEVDHDVAREVIAEVRALTARLRTRTGAEPLGIQVGPDGRTRAHGNAVIGLRNPVAPPLHVQRSPDGRAWASFRLGPQYEGPPGLVHGGVSALLLDQLCGEAAAAGGAPGMTGRLTLSYRRPTPLGQLSAEAWIDEVHGYKTTVRGHLKDADGTPTVEAEGLFILPRWARELMEQQAEKPDRFE
ncbi:MAG: PaaI family thioesterase [Actinomycetes bacterium]